MTRRTLVARLDSVGDVILTGPAVRAVARHHEVVYLCSDRGTAAARLLPGIDEIIRLHAPWIDAEPEMLDETLVRRFIWSVRRARVDEAAILVSSHQSPLPLALLLRVAGVKRIAAVSHDYAGSLLDFRIKGDPDVHEVERNLSVMAALGHVPARDDDTRLRLRHQTATAVHGVSGAIVVHPGASVPARTWSVDQWHALAAALAARGHRVVVTGATGERSTTRKVARAAGSQAVDLGGQTDLATLASAFRGASVVCSGNTGPMHLAAAAGTPVVAVFPPTVPADRWRPWKVPHVLLGDQDIECGGCRARRCPVQGHPCVSGVSIEAAVAGVEKLLRRDDRTRTTALAGATGVP